MDWWKWLIALVILVGARLFLGWWLRRMNRKQAPTARMEPVVPALETAGGVPAESEIPVPVVKADTAPQGDEEALTPEAEMEAAAPIQDKASVPDELARVEGIGPKISTVLQAAGIVTFQKLAETDVPQLQRILEDAGIRLADPSTWPEQAALAAAGRWAELKTLQSEFVGGRRP